MRSTSDLSALLVRLRAAGSVPDCLNVLVDSRSVAGYRIVGYREARHVPAVSRMPRPQWWAERMGWPRGLLQEWIRRNLAELDPMLAGAVMRPGALTTWKLAEPTPLRGRAKVDQARLAAFEFLASYGIRDGIVATVRRRDGQLGYLSWLVPASFAPERPVDSHGLILLAEMFFEALDRVRPPDLGEMLSPIERRCLAWAAYGCTDKEIAAELDRSMDTVRFHMKRVLKKLGAANRTHAVAVGMQKGLIRLGSTPRMQGRRTGRPALPARQLRKL